MTISALGAFDFDRVPGQSTVSESDPNSKSSNQASSKGESSRSFSSKYIPPVGRQLSFTELIFCGLWAREWASLTAELELGSPELLFESSLLIFLFFLNMDRNSFSPRHRSVNSCIIKDQAMVSLQAGQIAWVGTNSFEFSVAFIAFSDRHSKWEIPWQFVCGQISTNSSIGLT